MPRANGVVIVAGARTPVGAFLGGLSGMTPTALGVVASRAALEWAGVGGELVDAVVMGSVIPSAKDSFYMARHVGLEVGVPVEAPALMVNRACGSGVDAVVQAARQVMLGESQVVLAGGAENMSMTPYAMRGVRQGWKLARQEVDDLLMTALHDDKAGCSIGQTVEHLAGEQGITREEADAYTVWAQQRAAQAQAAGLFDEEIVPVQTPGRRGRLVAADEALRPGTTIEGLAALPGLFARDGVVTAGNSCGLNDAAASVVVASEAVAQAHGLKPLGRLVSWGTSGVAPLAMGLGPVRASALALEAAGLAIEDVDVIEINDSFAVQYLATERAMGLDRERVNLAGGALALGHPLAATGTRLILTALLALRRSGQQYGLCTLCIGGGQGIAAVVEVM